MKSLLLLALCSLALFSANAADTNWPSYNTGDRVEIDAACTGNWHRATITKIEPDPYSAKARKFTVQREDGSDWSFSGPGIVAPCMRALSAAATQPVQPGSAQPLQGLYLQLQSTGTAYAYVHYYFWKDGRVCQGLPSGGLDREPADFASIQKQKTCGQYRISGDRMSLQMQGEAAHDVHLYHFHPDSFEMNGYTTSKVASFGSSQHLSGNYSATVVGNQVTKQTYVFHPDGSYQFTSHPIASQQGAAQYAGTYRLFGNTLQLTGAPGTGRLTGYPFPNGGVMIEGSVFSQ